MQISCHLSPLKQPAPKYIVALQDAPVPEGQQGHGLQMRDKHGRPYSCTIPGITDIDHDALNGSASAVRVCRASWHSVMTTSGLEAVHCSVMQCVQDSIEGCTSSLSAEDNFYLL